MWRQAKQITLWTKSRWVQRAYMVFNKVEDVGQLKYIQANAKLRPVR